jgi:hypothetical protein
MKPRCLRPSGARSFVKVVYIVHALVWAVPRSKPAGVNRAALEFIAFVTAATALITVIDKLRQHSLPNEFAAERDATERLHGRWQCSVW